MNKCNVTLKRNSDEGSGNDISRLVTQTVILKMKGTTTVFIELEKWFY